MGLSETRVLGRIGQGGQCSDWLFARSGRVSGRWVDGIPASELADGGRGFSVRLVGENAQQLLEGDPALRRRFLDWNLFHVQPGYGPALRRFRQVLDQRNAWLRQGARGRAVWDEELVAAGESLDALRHRGMERIDSSFRSLADGYACLAGTGLGYSSGLPRDRGLADALRSDRETERALGYTRIGPHRADFRVCCEERALALSRGQQKGAVCLIQLACGAVQESLRGTGSLWLLDDLWGDMDEDSVGLLLPLFLGDGRQCLFTTIGPDAGARQSLLPADIKMFHVEQGRILAR